MPKNDEISGNVLTPKLSKKFLENFDVGVKKINSIFSAIDELSTLEHNWDTYDGEPMQLEALKIARNLALPLFSCLKYENIFWYDFDPTIGPMASGNIEFYLRFKDKELMFNTYIFEAKLNVLRIKIKGEYEEIVSDNYLEVNEISSEYHWLFNE